MSEVLAKVKQELGRDAVILHTRTVKRGGVLGVGSKSMVEVTATVDDRVTAMRKQMAAADEPVAPPAPSAPAAGLEDRMITETQKPLAAQLLPATNGDSPAMLDSALRDELEQIRRMVEEIMRQQRMARTPKIPSELIDYYADLIGQDVAGELAGQLMTQLRKRLADRIGSTDLDAAPSGAIDAVIRGELLQIVAEMVPPAEPPQLTAAGRPTVIAFVGPTGVGKTTTIAKLAANLKLRDAKRVGLITIDAYRIAAIEQLRTYAGIMDVPLHAVVTPEDMHGAMEQLSGVDVVLIDTAGRSQKDDLRINELNRFLAAAKPDQVHLVLSCTSREATIREAVAKFAVCGASHVVFTKIDESIGFGVLLNVLRTVDLRLSYLTNGQSVPGDIEHGTAQRIAELIVGRASSV